MYSVGSNCDVHSASVTAFDMMHLSRKVVKPVRFYTLGGEVITSVEEAKYLGVCLSSNYGTRSSQWKPHITEIAHKANQRLGFLRRNLGGCPYRLTEEGYISLVRSCCPACRTTLVATRFRVAVICPIIQVPHCIRVFFYFVWFVFINHIFQFYYELCTYCNILDIYRS